MSSLKSLNGLGAKSQEKLHSIGITTKKDLHDIGPVRAYMKLKAAYPNTVSLNFLYAMVGALENVDWREIANEEKGRLLTELEGYEELRQLIGDDLF